MTTIRFETGKRGFVKGKLLETLCCSSLVDDVGDLSTIRWSFGKSTHAALDLSTIQAYTVHRITTCSAGCDVVLWWFCYLMAISAYQHIPSDNKIQASVQISKSHQDMVKLPCLLNLQDEDSKNTIFLHTKALWFAFCWTFALMIRMHTKTSGT